MAILLRVWFVASACLAAMFLGWALGRAPLPWGTIAAGGIVAFILLRRRATATKKTSASAVHLLRSTAIASVLFGTYVAQSNAWNINEWLSNSVVLLDGIVSPVTFFDDDDAAVVLTDTEKRIMADKLKKLSLKNAELPASMLLSFKAGLAVADGKNVRFITNNGWMLALSGLLPDGSFLLYNAVSDRLTPAQRTSDRDVFVRAMVQDGVLKRIWERKTAGLYIHHWGDAYDGKIYQPGRTFITLPTEDAQRMGFALGKCARPSINDRILVFDAQSGDHLTSIDVLPLIADLKESDDTLAKAIWNCSDPIHLNDIQIIKDAQHAAEFPGGKIGDMLISMREVSALALLDRDSHAIKWYLRGTFRMQHAPRLTDRGTLLLFDNRGGSKENGRSRILEIDIGTKQVVGLWEATGSDYFDGDVRGKLLLTGSTIVVQNQSIDARPSSMFLLTCDSFPISQACKKTEVFSTTQSEFQYDNAIFLP